MKIVVQFYNAFWEIQTEIFTDEFYDVAAFIASEAIPKNSPDRKRRRLLRVKRTMHFAVFEVSDSVMLNNLLHGESLVNDLRTIVHLFSPRSRFAANIPANGSVKDRGLTDLW